eukprot:COSAG02_NODE_1708_length_11229_cov_14.784097_4_plen_125_part_00
MLAKGPGQAESLWPLLMPELVFYPTKKKILQMMVPQVQMTNNAQLKAGLPACYHASRAEMQKNGHPRHARSQLLQTTGSDVAKSSGRHEELYVRNRTLRISRLTKYQIEHGARHSRRVSSAAMV